MSQRSPFDYQPLEEEVKENPVLSYLIPYIRFWNKTGESRIERGLVEIRLYFSFAPTQSPYPEFGADEEIDHMVAATAQNRPKYQLDRLQDGLKWISTTAGRLSMLDFAAAIAEHDYEEDELNPPRPDRRTRDYIYKWLKGIFQYPPERQQDIGQFLKTANAPNFALAIKSQFGSPFDDREMPTLLVEDSQKSISLESVFKISYLGPKYIANPLAGILASVISDLLFGILVSKTPLGQQIQTRKQQNDNWEFYSWLDRTIALETDEAQAVISNPQTVQVFRPYSDLLALYFDFQPEKDSWWKIYEPILADNGGQSNPIIKNKLLALVKDRWSDSIWTANNISKLLSGIFERTVTLPNLTAVYAVAAPFYQFSPDLLLYLYPEQRPVVESFWARYGDAISYLQKLMTSFMRWWEASKSLVKTKIPSSRRDTRNESLVESLNLCDDIVRETASPERLQELRYQLLQLSRDAIVEGVPLTFLYSNDYPEMPKSNSFSEMRMYAQDILDTSGIELRSSLWWFDVLGNWADLICRKQLEAKLYQIVGETMPLEVANIKFQADEVLEQSMVQYLSGTKLPTLIQQINQTDLPEDVKQETIGKLRTLIQNKNAMRTLRNLNKEISAGANPDEMAEYLRAVIDF